MMTIPAVAYEFDGPSGRVADPTAFTWILDGAHSVGGNELAFVPTVGWHNASVTLRWQSEEASSSIAFEVTEAMLEDLHETARHLQKLRASRGLPQCMAPRVVYHSVSPQLP